MSSKEPFRKMIEDYYADGTPIPWYSAYIPLQWVTWEDWHPSKFVGQHTPVITEKDINNLAESMKNE